ncbi:MAG: DUF3169 family protein [Anaerostipes sp.]|nr:DUF3169 family protein [Anaerostipes sp.]
MNKREEIRKENRKSLVGFFIILMVSAIVGGVIGGLGYRSTGFFSSIGKQLKDFMAMNSFYIMLLGAVLFQGVTWAIYLSAKKLFEAWDGENEETADKIDTKIGCMMWIQNVNVILAFFLFALGIGLQQGAMSAEFSLINTVVFVLNIGVTIIGQQKAIDFTKEMNPEKKGSVYDIKFQDKWMKSCDEAEKLKTYESAWKAFKVMNTTYVFAWLVTVLAQMIMGIGIFACIMISVLWMIQTSVYYYHSIYKNR